MNHQAQIPIPDPTQKEHTSRDHEERYQTIVEHAYDLICELTVDGQYMYVSPNHLQMLGYAPAALLGRNAAELVHPDDLPHVFAELRNSSCRGQSLFRVRHYNGEWRWLESTSQGYQTAQGEWRGVLISRDVTERKQTEDELQRSQKQYQALVHSIDGIVWEADAETFTFTFVSPQAERLLGYPVERWLTEPDFWSNHIHPEDRDWAINFCLTATAERRTHQLDYRMIAADGRTVWVHDLVSVIVENGRPVKLRGVISDITVRRQAETALQESEARYRTLVEGSIQGISIVAQGKFLFANSAFAAMLGYESPEVLLGRTVWEHVAPNEHDRLQGYQAARLRGDPAPTRYELQAVKQDGDSIWLEHMVSPIMWQGAPAFLITAYDITERKQAEEEKQQLQTQLFQAQKLQALGTLAGGIAHDFNNILTMIIGFSELVQQAIPVGTISHNNLEEVLKAAHRAKNLVRQILTFSRPSEQQQQVIELHPIVTQTLRFLWAIAPSTVTIRYDLDHTAGRVRTDSSHIHQVLMNLSINAIHAMKEKGGVLEISLQQVEIEGDFARLHPPLQPGRHLTLTVRDTGGGIAPEVLPRIFDPFFTTKPSGEGSGLGLSVVYGIVRRHQGAITVESQLGSGTTFTVYLPVAAEPIVTAKADESLPCSG